MDLGIHEYIFYDLFVDSTEVEGWSTSNPEHLKAILSLKMPSGPGDPEHEVLKGSKLIPPMNPRDPIYSKWLYA